MRRHAAWLVAAILAAGAAPARAATFDVTKPDDGADARCDADCSLRDAVIAADQSPGPDTITLHEQTYLLSVAAIVDPLDPEADTPERGDLDVTDDVTIAGAGAGQSIIDGGRIDRVIDVAPGASARLSGLAVRNGRVGPTRSGAGIRNGGTLELSGVALSGNESRGNGGAILNTGALTMADSVVADNLAVATGGIANRGTASLTGVTLSGNRGAEAPAAFDNRGTATVTNSTVSGSQTTVEGTAVASSSGRMALRNVTLGANAGGAGSLLGAFFDGEVTLVNTIVDGPCDGSVTSLGHNVERGNKCGLAGAGDLIDTDPLLEPLADNGGPTSTHAPAPASPAVDAGDDASCPGTDQRGVSRPQGAHCDAGAVERAAGNTPIGANVKVVAGPVMITFAHITAAGDTTVTPSPTGPAPPAGFAVDGGYYELATTAQFDTAEVCFAYAAPPPPAIGHFENGAWRILGPTRDTGTDVCAQVSSFSPFATLRATGVADQLRDLLEQPRATPHRVPGTQRLHGHRQSDDPGGPGRGVDRRRSAHLRPARVPLMLRHVIVAALVALAQRGQRPQDVAADRPRQRLGRQPPEVRDTTGERQRRRGGEAREPAAAGASSSLSAIRRQSRRLSS